MLFKYFEDRTLTGWGPMKLNSPRIPIRRSAQCLGSKPSSFDAARLAVPPERSIAFVSYLLVVLWLPDGANASILKACRNFLPHSRRLSASAYPATTTPNGSRPTDLVPGTYTNLARWPFVNPGQAGLDISIGSLGMNQVPGSFDIIEADWDPDGTLSSFAARFQCLGPNIRKRNSHSHRRRLLQPICRKCSRASTG